MNFAVIGNNYGDEGKGLAVDYLTLSGHNLVVRHNGGAQAAHTVDREDKRFVFHELSSGSFNGADTYWARTFFPDLYKLEKELADFSEVSANHIKIFASPLCHITLLYDVYLNQKREEARGEDKHGSCGMGIWEATKRSLTEYGLTLGDIASLSVADLSAKLRKIEDEYVSQKVAKFGIDEMLNLDTDSYAQILKSVLEKRITLIDNETEFFRTYDNVVFEGGQGLLLDTGRVDLWPHTTCSRTNVTNPVTILEENGILGEDMTFTNEEKETDKVTEEENKTDKALALAIYFSEHKKEYKWKDDDNMTVQSCPITYNSRFGNRLSKSVEDDRFSRSQGSRHSSRSNSKNNNKSKEKLYLLFFLLLYDN